MKHLIKDPKAFAGHFPDLSASIAMVNQPIFSARSLMFDLVMSPKESWGLASEALVDSSY
jgi:hypothetical protein